MCINHLTEGQQAGGAAALTLGCCFGGCSSSGTVWRSGSSRSNGSTSPSGSAHGSSSGFQLFLLQLNLKKEEENFKNVLKNIKMKIDIFAM